MNYGDIKHHCLDYRDRLMAMMMMMMMTDAEPVSEYLCEYPNFVVREYRRPSQLDNWLKKYLPT